MSNSTTNPSLKSYLDLNQPYICAESEGDACHCKGTVFYGDKYHSVENGLVISKSSDLNHEVLTLDELKERPF